MAAFLWSHKVTFLCLDNNDLSATQLSKNYYLHSASQFPSFEYYQINMKYKLSIVILALCSVSQANDLTVEGSLNVSGGNGIMVSHGGQGGDYLYFDSYRDFKFYSTGEDLRLKSFGNGKHYYWEDPFGVPIMDCRFIIDGLSTVSFLNLDFFQIRSELELLGGLNLKRWGTPVFPGQLMDDSQTLYSYVDDSDVYFFSEQDENSGPRGGFIFVLDNDLSQLPSFKVVNKSAPSELLLEVDSNGKLTANSFDGDGTSLTFTPQGDIPMFGQ